MRVVVLEDSLLYDGRQLATAFLDRHAPGAQDALVLFEGGADVPTEALVDLEDAEAGDCIFSPRMVHALVEHRGLQLVEAVWRQRLMVRLAAAWLAGRSGRTIDVRGNDLYYADGKLSVSVATTSPRGTLTHFAVNIETAGAPVRAAGLQDLRINPREFLQALGRLYAEEVAAVLHAAGKVRPVA
ncbi:MAG: DUF366 family protein [Planctomycetota bacterium]